MPRHGHDLFWFIGWGCSDISIGSLSFLSSCLSLRLSSCPNKPQMERNSYVHVRAKVHLEVWGCPKLLLNPSLHHPSQKVSVLGPPGARRPLLSMQGAFWVGKNYNTALMRKDTTNTWGKESSLRWAVKRGKERGGNRALWWSWYLWGWCPCQSGDGSEDNFSTVRACFVCKNTAEELCMSFCLGLGAGAQINTGLEPKVIQALLVMQVIQCEELHDSLKCTFSISLPECLIRKTSKSWPSASPSQ